MALEIFKLFGSVFVDNTKANQSLSETGAKAGSLATGFINAGKKIAKGAVVVAGAAAAIGGAMIANAKSVAEYGDSVDKASQKMGVSAKFYQEWDAVLQHSGTSMDKMGGSFKKLASAAQNASATQEAAFQRLGLSMEDVKNMSTEELFKNVISGLQSMEEGTERTYIATKLLGGGAAELGALFNTSAEDTQAMIDQVNALGGVLSDEAIKASAEFNDKLQDMTTGFDSLKKNIGAEFLPVLNTLMGWVIEQMPTIQATFAEVKDAAEIGFQLMTAGAEMFFQALEDGKAFVEDHQTAITLLGIAILTLTTAFGAYTAAQAISNAGGIVAIATSTAETVALYGMIAAETAATVATTALSAAVAFLTSPVTLVIAAIGLLVAAGVLLYKNWDTVKSKATELGNGVKTTFSSMLSGVKTVWNNVTSTITGAIDTAKSKVKNGVDAIKGFFSFKFSWPKLPLPHFAVKPSGWKIGDLLKGSIPSLGVSWYARAYQNPVLLDSPTIFGAAGGRLLGGGDGHGAELVGGEQRVRSMIRSAVSEGMEGGGYSEIVEILLAILQWLKDNPPPQGGGYGPRDMDMALGRLYSHAVRGV